MLIWRSLIVAGFLPDLLLVLAHTDHADFACGTLPSNDYREVSKRFAQEAKLDRRKLDRRYVQDIQVDVYIHVVARSERPADGYLNDDALNNQFQVLKADYAPAGIVFHLKSIDKTINATWADNTDLERMWADLRNGSYNDLNLWFIPTLRDFGFCTLPVSGEKLAHAILEDGCTIRSDTVPGGNAKNYNMGKTVTHEVGHWFGLLHTFEGGCEGDGDYIDDTPAQASPSMGCPEGRDSCPDQPGLDPIHNFMDYSYDTCYKEFTPGQAYRMMQVWNTFRSWAAFTT